MVGTRGGHGPDIRGVAVPSVGPPGESLVRSLDTGYGIEIPLGIGLARAEAMMARMKRTAKADNDRMIRSAVVATRDARPRDRLKNVKESQDQVRLYKMLLALP